MRNFDRLLLAEYKQVYLLLKKRLLKKRNLEEFRKTKDRKWLKEVEKLDKIYQETVEVMEGWKA